MPNQHFLIQHESEPGEVATDDLRAYLGLRATPEYETDGESFKASGYRATTSHTVTEEAGGLDVEAPQCFNAVTPVFAGVLGMPETELLYADNGDNGNGGGSGDTVGETVEGTVGTLDDTPIAARHTFILLARGRRSPATFTGVWGDEDFAFLLPFLTFTELDFGVQKAELTFDTSGISRTPEEDFTFPDLDDVQEIEAVPIPPNAYDLYLDDDPANRGETKFTEAYDAGISIGETWGKDNPINSAYTAYRKLVENNDIDYTGEMQVGIGEELKPLLSSFRRGSKKYARLAVEGPVIAGDLHYSLELDYSFIVTAPGGVEEAPNSPVDVLSFEYDLTNEPDTGHLIKVTVVNDVLGL